MQSVSVFDRKGVFYDKIKSYSFWNKYHDFKIVDNCITSINELDVHLCETKSDILIFVIGSPQMDLEYISSILKFHSKLRIIAVGYQKEYAVVRSYFTSGVFDYLIGDFTEEIFEEAVSRLYETEGVSYILNNLRLKTDALIANIFLGGGQEQIIVRQIIDQIYEDWNNDSVNCQVVAQKAKNYIYEILIDRKPWLEKFLYKNDFADVTKYALFEKDAIADEWVSAFTQASAMVRKYQMIDDKLVYKIGKFAVVHVDEMLSLDDVSRGVFLNSSYISHIFKKTTGVSFVDFMTEVKIDRAKILLRTPDVLIKEVAQTLGYSSQEYFSRLFKKKTGITPVQFQNDLSAELSGT